MPTKTTRRNQAGVSGPAAIALAAAGVGLAVGLAANLVRKAILQAPTVAAGRWDEALAGEHKAALTIFDQREPPMRHRPPGAAFS